MSIFALSINQIWQSRPNRGRTSLPSQPGHVSEFCAAEIWHQFPAAADQPLGLLCLVRQDRDHPRLPEPGPPDRALSPFQSYEG
jgi:hypothetical protein